MWNAIGGMCLHDAAAGGVCTRPRQDGYQTVVVFPVETTNAVWFANSEARKCQQRWSRWSFSAANPVFPRNANQPRRDSLALSLKEAPSTDVIRPMCTLPCLPCFASQRIPCRCYHSSTLHLHLLIAHSLPNIARLHLATQTKAVAYYLPS